MIAVGFDHRLGLVIEHLLHRCPRRNLIPHSGLRLEIDADLVGCLKRGFGWAERVKTNVIDAPIFIDLEYLSPVCNVGRRIACERKITAVMCAAKIYAAPVELKFLTDGFNVAESK